MRPTAFDFTPGLRQESGAGWPGSGPPADPTPAPRPPAPALGVAVLVGLAVLLGTLGLTALLVPSLLPTATNKRVERYLHSPSFGGASVAGGKRGGAPGAASRGILALVGSLGKTLARLSPKGYTTELQNQL